MGYRFLFLFVVVVFSCKNGQKGKPEEQGIIKSEKLPKKEIQLGPRANCLVDLEAISKESVIKSNPDFESYEWTESDSVKRAKILLKNGDSLNVDITGCKEYVIHATLTLYNNHISFVNHKYWFGQAMWIAEHIHGFEPKHLQDVHDHKAYEEHVYEDVLLIDFDHHDYDMLVDKYGGATHVILAHHFNKIN